MEVQLTTVSGSLTDHKSRLRTFRQTVAPDKSFLSALFDFVTSFQAG